MSKYGHLDITMLTGQFDSSLGITRPKRKRGKSTQNLRPMAVTSGDPTNQKFRKWDPLGPHVLGLRKIHNMKWPEKNCTWIWMKSGHHYLRCMKPHGIPLNLSTEEPDFGRQESNSSNLKDSFVGYNFPQTFQGSGFFDSRFRWTLGFCGNDWGRSWWRIHHESKHGTPTNLGMSVQ